MWLVRSRGCQDGHSESRVDAVDPLAEIFSQVFVYLIIMMEMI